MGLEYYMDSTNDKLRTLKKIYKDIFISFMNLKRTKKEPPKEPKKNHDKADKIRVFMVFKNQKRTTKRTKKEPLKEPKKNQ